MGVKKAVKKLIGYPEHKPVEVGSRNETTRVTWLEKALKAIPAGHRILDAGAGEQQFKKFCDHLKYVCQDFAQYKPEELPAGLQMEKWDYGKLDIVSDIASIPEPDASFDAIMCTEVFEHIINPRDAMKEFSRLLKPGGILILTAPFCSLTHFAPYHFYSGFNSFFYENELKQNGFEVVEITPNGNFFEFMGQEIRRVASMAERYTSGPLTPEEKKTLYKTLQILDKYSKKDKGSAEVLCFGYQVQARRK